MVLFRHTWSTESMYLHVLYMTIGNTKEPNIQVYGNYKKALLSIRNIMKTLIFLTCNR